MTHVLPAETAVPTCAAPVPVDRPGAETRPVNGCGRHPAGALVTTLSRSLGVPIVHALRHALVTVGVMSALWFIMATDATVIRYSPLANQRFAVPPWIVVESAWVAMRWALMSYFLPFVALYSFTAGVIHDTEARVSYPGGVIYMLLFRLSTATAGWIGGVVGCEIFGHLVLTSSLLRSVLP